VGHIHEKYDFVVTVFLVHNNKVLFANHPRYGKWVPIGGHIELVEDPDEAIYREVREETGIIDIELLCTKPAVSSEPANKFLHQPNYVGVYEANPPHRHISLNYFARVKQPTVTMSDEHTAIAWLGLTDLDTKTYGLTPSLQFYATKAIEAAQEH
jgi:ADP-ribose pyrophosphatase YjhB (NUDIX family)